MGTAHWTILVRESEAMNGFQNDLQIQKMAKNPEHESLYT